MERNKPEAQRSGFGFERRCSGANETAGRPGGERYAACIDERGDDMARKQKKLICRGWVPDGKGGYRSVENDLTQEERDELGRWIIQTMGKAMNDYYSNHPEEYARL